MILLLLVYVAFANANDGGDSKSNATLLSLLDSGALTVFDVLSNGTDILNLNATSPAVELNITGNSDEIGVAHGPVYSAPVPPATTNQPTCQLTFQVQANQTCESIRNVANVSSEYLRDLNPGLNCSTLEKNDQLCISNDTTYVKLSRKELLHARAIGAAPAATPQEKFLENAQPHLATLSSATAQGLKQLRSTFTANRGGYRVERYVKYVCDGKFDLQKDPTIMATEDNCFNWCASAIINKPTYCEYDPNKTCWRCYGAYHLNQATTKDLYVNYFPCDATCQAKPEYAHTAADPDVQLASLLSKPESIPMIKALIAKDPDLTQVDTTFNQQRAAICAQFGKMGPTEEYKICVCDNTKPFLFCQAILMRNKATQQTQQSRRSRSPDVDASSSTAVCEASPRQKRDAKATVLNAYEGFRTFLKYVCPYCIKPGTDCFDLSKCFVVPQLPAVEVCGVVDICLPDPITLIGHAGFTVDMVENSEINFQIKLCISVINDLLDVLNRDFCFAKLILHYYYYRSQFEVEPYITLGLVKVDFSILIQVAQALAQDVVDTKKNVRYPELCNEDDYLCASYCRMLPKNVTATYELKWWWFFKWHSKTGDLKKPPPCRKKIPVTTPRPTPPPTTVNPNMRDEVYVACGKWMASAPTRASSPQRTYLTAGTQQVKVRGLWNTVKCNGKDVRVFQVSPVQYITLYQACTAAGYETAQPWRIPTAGQQLGEDAWQHPFLIVPEKTFGFFIGTNLFDPFILTQVHMTPMDRICK